MSGARHWRVGIVGCGAVGVALADLLAATRVEIAADHGVTTAIGLVATRRGGIVVATDGAPPGGGLDLPAIAVSLAGNRGRRLPGAMSGRAADAIASAPVDVIVELTPLDATAGEPATSHVRAALAADVHVITANKGPIALNGPELRAEAAAARLALRYEATLMDCLPVLALRDSAIPVGGIERFAAIPNSTSNHVLDAMARGEDRDAAVAEAQRLGIAEADPSFDLDGWDGAFKAAILAQHLLGLGTRATDVERVGMWAVDPAEPAAAVAVGERLRMVARGDHATGRVRVGPERVPASSALGAAGGFSMALSVETRLAGRMDLVLVEPHTPQTAYAVLMDLLAIDRDARLGTVRPGRGWQDPA